MNPIQKNVAVNKIVGMIQEQTTNGEVKNGMGVTRLAKLLALDPADVAECCALAVQRGKLVAGKGRGGSFRLAGVAHVQNQWGARTGNVKGVWHDKHVATGFVSRGRGKTRKAVEAVAETDGAVA
jgi:hypothetical protein